MKHIILADLQSLVTFSVRFRNQNIPPAKLAGKNKPLHEKRTLMVGPYHKCGQQRPRLGQSDLGLCWAYVVQLRTYGNTVAEWRRHWSDFVD